MNDERDKDWFSAAWAAVASAIAWTVLVLLSIEGTADLGAYLGDRAPWLVAAVVCAGGLFAMKILYRTAGFALLRPAATKRGFLMASLAVVPFAAGVTIADLVWRFPENINVPLPQAALFYPAIGFVAQLALHVIPLALLLAAGRMVPGDSERRWWIWLCIVLVSAIEAAIQVASAIDGGGQAAMVAYVAVSLWLFGVVELSLYRRFDFLTMYVFRLVYYGYWHLVWGSLRLEWLF